MEGSSGKSFSGSKGTEAWGMLETGSGIERSKG